ncbi:hypothetical protein OIB37_29460 [Streptomyces sp. NBC_00820]|uniref:hypothetical protein n=1 Tax=Streptomyces sp. NBC_00820 TaxID=2975842 RepID=UPI002ED1D36A|nr:hypothetical protein OIB37_29460 [Streptomyces sp. NBC_00820]
MTGTIAVYAEPPRLRRGGTFKVAIDGVTVGQVRQGDAARFPVAAGRHTVRVLAKDRTRSNTVTVDVAENQDFLVTTRSTGLMVATLLPFLAGAAFPHLYVIGAVLLIAAVFYAVPGLLFRVRADGDTERRASRASGETADELPNGSGLWWESDPVLAKRYRKDSAS